MKKLLNILALSAVALAAFSCNDAEYGVSEEIEAFFVESFDATGIAGLPLLVTDDGATAELTVSLTKKTRTGASFRLVVDQAVLDQYNKENNDSIYFVDSSGWIPLEPLHPLRDGHITVAKHLTEELKKILLDVQIVEHQ